MINQNGYPKKEEIAIVGHYTTAQKGANHATPQKTHYTSEDYWNLPENSRAELIGGQLYNMAPPSRVHQKLVSGLLYAFRKYIEEHGGNCEVYPAPFAVNLDAEDTNWVEPDLSVICDPSKLTDRGCSGAPDLIIEVVSPGSRKMDYGLKNTIYSQAGVREYWVIDPVRESTLIYFYECDAAPTIVPFNRPAAVGIYKGLQITVSDFFE